MSSCSGRGGPRAPASGIGCQYFRHARISRTKTCPLRLIEQYPRGDCRRRTAPDRGTTHSSARRPANMGRLRAEAPHYLQRSLWEGTMRILMLAQFYPPIIGGEERHVRDLSIELAPRGHQVPVPTLCQPAPPPFQSTPAV